MHSKTLWKCKAGHTTYLVGLERSLDGKEKLLCAEIVEFIAEMRSGVTLDILGEPRQIPWKGWCMQECEELP